jgi:hypothetical protein
LLSDGVIQREGSLESILRTVTSDRKRVWIQFDGSLDASTLSLDASSQGQLQQLETDSLTGLLYAKELGELIAQAKTQGLQLRNLRIEGSELADLLSGETP